MDTKDVFTIMMCLTAMSMVFALMVATRPEYAEILSMFTFLTISSMTMFVSFHVGAEYQKKQAEAKSP